MDTRVIEVTDFKSEVRFRDNLESNIGNYRCRSWEAPLLFILGKWLHSRFFADHNRSSPYLHSD